jgi:hypothetical protein
MHTEPSHRSIFTPQCWGDLFPEAKSRIKEHFDAKNIDSSSGFQELVSSYVSFDVCEHLKRIVEDHPQFFFPNLVPREPYNFSVSRRPNETYRIIFGKDALSSPEILLHPLDFPNDKAPWTKKYPYEATVDIRDTLSFYPASFYVAFSELMSASLEWLTGRYIALSTENPIAEILSILGQDPRYRFLLKDIHFVLFLDGVGSYAPTGNSAGNTLFRMKNAFGDHKALDFAAELNCVVLSQGLSFSRLPQCESIYKEGLDISDAASEYSGDLPFYYKAERTAIGKHICVERIIGDANSKIGLYAVHPPTIGDVSGLFVRFRTALNNRLLSYFESSKAKTYIELSERAKDQITATGGGYAHLLHSEDQEEDSRIISPKEQQKHITYSYPSVGTPISILDPSCRQEHIDYNVDFKKNGKVKSLSIVSPLSKNPEIGTSRKIPEEVLEDHVEDIRRILNEKGIEFPSQEVEDEAIREIRESTNQYTEEVLRLVSTQDGTPADKFRPVATNVEVNSILNTADCVALAGWPDNRERSRYSNRRENAVEFIERVYDPRVYGPFRLWLIRKKYEKLHNALASFKSRSKKHYKELSDKVALIARPNKAGMLESILKDHPEINELRPDQAFRLIARERNYRYQKKTRDD